MGVRNFVKSAWARGTGRTEEGASQVLGSRLAVVEPAEGAYK